MKASNPREYGPSVKPAPVFAALACICLAWCAWTEDSGAIGEVVRTEAITIEHPNLPTGYEMAAYVDCGEQDTSGEETQGCIALVTGAAHTFPGIEGPLAAVTYWQC
ncbi:MAG: hypothetical protein R6V12_07105 [Candidatus Hydrogenedentota bacterium]